MPSCAGPVHGPSFGAHRADEYMLCYPCTAYYFRGRTGTYSALEWHVSSPVVCANGACGPLAASRRTVA